MGLARGGVIAHHPFVSNDADSLSDGSIGASSPVDIRAGRYKYGIHRGSIVHQDDA
jgi:hypothetical protein